MLRLGITGGIGSGKTLVCSIFSQLGVPVYNADTRAKWLVNNIPELKDNLIVQFGEETFRDGVYNSKYIGHIVFNDVLQLSMLNQIIHPYVFRDWDIFCQEHQAQPIVIKEAAIMLETESKHTVDKIALVYAPEHLRIQRVTERDGITEEALRAKIKMQMPEEEKLKLADYIILNDGENSLIEQVQQLHRELTGV